MKVIIKIVAVLAIVIGLMATVTGSRVLLGLFEPGYQYFTALILYNVIVGLISIGAGIIIWKQNNKAILIAAIIAGLHLSVLLLLVTIFRDIISDHSVNAMTFRSIIWIVFSIIIWKLNPKLKEV